jgi:hypothetical protein
MGDSATNTHVAAKLASSSTRLLAPTTMGAKQHSAAESGSAGKNKYSSESESGKDRKSSSDSKDSEVRVITIINLNKMHKASPKQCATTKSGTTRSLNDSDSGNNNESSSDSKEAEQSCRELS